jgi:hypothetical protein
MADVRYFCTVTDPRQDVTERVQAACREGTALVPVVPRVEPKGARESIQPAVEKEPKVVRIQCADGHWCDFPCRPPDGATEVIGAKVGAAEQTRWDTWREQSDPLKGLERIEGYAKWVLGANALVVLLAGSFAATGAVDPKTTWAKLLYAVAIAFLGLSWAALSLSIAPKWIRINRHSPTDFVEGFNQQYTSRRRWLSAATTALGLALVAAAFVPLGERTHEPPTSSAGIAYEVKSNGAVEAKLAGAGLPPHTPVELVLRAAGSPADKALMRRRALVDSVGKVDVSLTLDSVRAKAATKPLLLTGRWMVRPGSGLVPRQDTVPVP